MPGPQIIKLDPAYNTRQCSWDVVTLAAPTKMIVINLLGLNSKKIIRITNGADAHFKRHCSMAALSVGRIPTNVSTGETVS